MIGFFFYRLIVATFREFFFGDPFLFKTEILAMRVELVTLGHKGLTVYNY